jgi:glycosyltransferase involved in cell wall biosynthesis
MRLDVIVPTFNRQELLQRTLQSLLIARVPPGLTVGVTVVDNNSSDDTRRVVEDWQAKFTDRLNYVFERKQGRSHALNAGIESTDGDLIGFIDDDEEIEESWYDCVHNSFSTMDVDFIGGPYIPRWEIDPPSWLPKEYCGVIGSIEVGELTIPYDETYPGILMGGNAVLTRAIFTKVGRYLTAVGRSGARLLAGEDEDMYQRLLEANAKGVYLPNLKIFHFIPAERLTKRYFRKWCFWRGVSLGVLDRNRPSKVAYLGGVPRYLYGKAARGGLRNLIAPLRTSNPAQRFSNELAMWDLLGFFYGKHFYVTK